MPRTANPEIQRAAVQKTSLASQYRAIGPAHIAAALLCAAKKKPASGLYKAA